MARRRKSPKPQEPAAPPPIAVPEAADIDLYGSADSANWSKADIQHAGEDARKMLADSAILRAFVHMMIFSRQLYIVAREQINAEVAGGWKVSRPRLVIETLVQSAQNKAVEPTTMAELREAADAIVQTLDILKSAEAEKAADDARASGVITETTMG